MQFFCYLGALSCIGMYWFTAENIYFGIVCFFFGLIGFWGSLVFYNSYLPDIAHKEQQDSLSAKGYSMGYIGSVILLALNLFIILGKEGQEALDAMRMAFAMTGIWWILFAQYAFWYLPKGNKNADKITKDVIFNGFKELKKVQSQLYQNVKLYRYLVAFFVYSMAVQTVMLVATYFGEQEINWSTDSEKTTGLIISILVIQLVAVIGATLTSRASEKFGNIRTLIVINAIWAIICVFAYFVTEPIHFYVTAGFVGLVMGGIQALSRSTYSKFLPKTEDTASFFSFYDVAEKIGIVIGMAIYGTIDQITGSMRNAIVFLMVFFVAGLLLLLRVPKNTASEE
jgi:MFS transporter, UMF1 family